MKILLTPTHMIVMSVQRTPGHMPIMKKYEGPLDLNATLQILTHPAGDEGKG